jgi:glutamate-5-semialdehyde dehydrogenase
MALRLIESSLDRLGVCNRLNLLLIQQRIWDATVPLVTRLADKLGIRVSLPPHDHPLGLEWALQPGSEATITIAPAAEAADAAAIANRETSGLAASIVTADATAAGWFLDAYAGTGAFWNASPRLLDGFKLLSVPETGINIDLGPSYLPHGPHQRTGLARSGEPSWQSTSARNSGTSGTAPATRCGAATRTRIW